MVIMVVMDIMIAMDIMVIMVHMVMIMVPQHIPTSQNPTMVGF